MKRRKIFKRRLGGALALGLAVAAIAVPTAGAAFPDGGGSFGSTTPVRPDDRATHGPGIAPPEADAVVRPDDRPAHGVGTAPIPSAPGFIRFESPSTGPVTDGLGRPLVPEAGPQSIPVADEAPSSGTDWLAVGLGAGAGLALLLAAGIGAVVTRRRNTGKLASA